MVTGDGFAAMTGRPGPPKSRRSSDVPLPSMPLASVRWPSRFLFHRAAAGRSGANPAKVADDRRCGELRRWPGFRRLTATYPPFLGNLPMRRTAFTLALVAYLATPAAPARAETAKEVIQKAIDAMGGADTIKKYPGAKSSTKGKLSVMGLEVELEGETTYLLPDKAKTVMKIEVLG